MINTNKLNSGTMKDGENENMKEEREKESWNLQHWLHGLGIP